MQSEEEARLLALLKAEDYYRSEKSLSHFISSAWTVLEPGREYLPNWHIDLISEYLEAVDAGEIRKLVINMPFRHLKSISVTVCFPVWTWIKNPEKRFLCASYADELSIKHNLDRRNLIKSRWFQLAWSRRFKLSDDDDRKRKFTNDRRGQMFATSVGGTATGEGSDCTIIDDPLNPKMAASELLRDAANTWRDQTISTRKNTEDTPEIIVMQRLHENDLTGHVLPKGGWTHLSLPWEQPTKMVIKFPRSERTITRDPGDVLHPERFGKHKRNEFLEDLGTSGYQAQLQQDPRPSVGGFIKRSWWKRYGAAPAVFLEKGIFIDCASKPGISNDYTVMATWGRTESGFYCLDVWRNRVEFPDLLRAVKDLYAKHKPGFVMIEDAAAGIQLIQTLQVSTTIPVFRFDPSGRSKEVRAAGAQPSIESGKCHLPDIAPWAEDFILEHEKFPAGAYDDQVDTTSMMVERFLSATPQYRIRRISFQ